MSGIAERKRLRETRARPWLVNSIVVKVKKLTCRRRRERNDWEEEGNGRGARDCTLQAYGPS